MVTLTAILGAVVSAVGALVAWYSGIRMKNYELAQGRTAKVLDKRFDVYPKVWSRCQRFLTTSATSKATKADIDSLCDDLRALHQLDGLYYSDNVSQALVNIVDRKEVFDPEQPLIMKRLEQLILGTSTEAGLVRSLRDDLGMYVHIAGSVLRPTDSIPA